MSILSLLFLFAVAQTPEEPAKVHTDAQPVEVQKVEKPEAQLQEKDAEFSYSFHGELSLETGHSKRGVQRNNISPSLQNIAVIADVQLSKHFLTSLEILGEQTQDSTNIYFGEIFLDYTLPVYENLRFKAGNMYYTYGLLTSLEGLLSKRPSYYTDLLVTRRGIDFGAEMLWQPIMKFPLGMSFSYFSGKTYRTGDQSIENPIDEPKVVSLHYFPKFMSAKLSYLNRHYYNRPELKAMGLELQSKDIYLYKDDVYFSVQSEFWDLRYTRLDGIERNGFTSLGGATVTGYGVFYRLLYSTQDWQTPGSHFAEVKNEFMLHGFGYKFNDYIHFEYQKITEKESQPGLSLITLDEDIYRIFLKF